MEPTGPNLLEDLDRITITTRKTHDATASAYNC